MSQHLVIDNVQFALQESHLEGTLGLSVLPRLGQEVVAKADSVVRYSLTGACDEHGEPRLMLRLSGDLVMKCQRCLQPMSFCLDVDATFGLRDGLDDNVLLQEDLEDDSCDFLPTSRTMDLVALIEDEALLALPPVPRHEDCDLPDMRHDPEAASPFGVLLKFKGQSGTTH